MKIKIWSGVLIGLISVHYSVALALELPGFGLDRTRVVFPADAVNGVMFTVNNNTETDYLVQAMVAPISNNMISPLPSEAGDISPPFIVVPPLLRLDSHGQQGFRIIRKAGTLPADRESVFTLLVKGIPNTPLSKTAGQGVLRLAIAVNSKLFYRPAGLPAGGVKVASKMLRFSWANGGLQVNNPSPFYLTFAHLVVGGKTVPSSLVQNMIPPFGQRVYALPHSGGSSVSWQLLDERGEATPEQRATL
ncbi:fimbrial biogenesis chaperone [Serratia marcescens]|uniref:fimbrial biogenesis chaperone n=1 Tax=Serratia marcescens TaxID=615 RepID=UPI002176F8B8|nr:molecular chaperone [Serratia marcescens]CAI1615987.1 Chaperone protein fimC precursor [Serratia marcescens]